jgi:hypothetical protein
MSFRQAANTATRALAQLAPPTALSASEFNHCTTYCNFTEANVPFLMAEWGTPGASRPFLHPPIFISVGVVRALAVRAQPLIHLDLLHIGTSFSLKGTFPKRKGKPRFKVRRGGLSLCALVLYRLVLGLGCDARF